MRTMQGAFVQLTTVVLGSTSEILFIQTTSQVKMSLVTEKQHGVHVEFPHTHYSAIFLVSLTEFQYQYHFIDIDEFSDP